VEQKKTKKKKKNENRDHANVEDTRSELTELKTRKTEIEVNRERDYEFGRRHDGESVGEECNRILLSNSLSTETEFFFNLCQQLFFSFCNISFLFFEVFYKLQHIYFLIVVKK
jgi:hypothetical protein